MFKLIFGFLLQYEHNNRRKRRHILRRRVNAFLRSVRYHCTRHRLLTIFITCHFSRVYANSKLRILKDIFFPMHELIILYIFYDSSLRWCWPIITYQSEIETVSPNLWAINYFLLKVFSPLTKMCMPLALLLYLWKIFRRDTLLSSTSPDIHSDESMWLLHGVDTF